MTTWPIDFNIKASTLFEANSQFDYLKMAVAKLYILVPWNRHKTKQSMDVNDFQQEKLKTTFDTLAQDM